MCAKLTDDYESAKICLNAANKLCDEMMEKLKGDDEVQRSVGAAKKQEEEVIRREVEKCMAVTVSFLASFGD